MSYQIGVTSVKFQIMEMVAYSTLERLAVSVCSSPVQDSVLAPRRTPCHMFGSYYSSVVASLNDSADDPMTGRELHQQQATAFLAVQRHPPRGL